MKANLNPAQIHESAPDEARWFAQIYRGDSEAQLTWRAVVTGALLGMLMAVSNLYTTLKVGWSFGVAITACVLSYVVWNAIGRLSGGRLGRPGILENNCMQSTASAAGYSTGTSVGTVFGAMLILDPAHQHAAWPVIALFTLSAGAMGVALAVPMKRQLINREHLPFPSGIAAATTLDSLHAGGADAARRAVSLVWSLVAGAVVGVLNTAEDQFLALGRFFAFMRERLLDVHLPAQVPERGFALLEGRPLLGFGFEPSALLISAGMLIGPRVTLSMFGGSLALYLWIAPWLHGLDQAAGLSGAAASLPLAGGGAFWHPVRWSLWGGVSLMVFAGLTALVLQWRMVARALQAVADALRGRAGAKPQPQDAIEVPGAWFLALFLPAAAALVALQVLAFGIAWWAGLVSVLMSFLVAVVACRAVGETDVTPIGPIGKVLQLTFALISPGNVTHNLVAGGTGASAATAAGDLLTDLKSGYLLGANPRRQFLAQAVGVIFGTLAVVPAWFLLIPNVEALEKYPLPATQVWVAVARVLSNGLDSLPLSARWAVLLGALLGIALPLAEQAFGRVRRWLPSAMGLGLGWVMVFSNSLSFALGAMLMWAWRRLHPATCEQHGVSVASGLIAGESLVKALLAMLATGIGLVA